MLDSFPNPENFGICRSVDPMSVVFGLLTRERGTDDPQSALG
jgi:hypothetical protein